VVMDIWPRAVLFDMDGTLVESHDNVERAWTIWAQRRGIDASDLLRDAHGLPAEVTAARWLTGASDAEIEAAAHEQLELQYDDVMGITAIDGAQELIAFMYDAAIAWAVHTSADDRLARARLGAAGIDPPVLVTRDQLKRGKPAPDGYLKAAELLEFGPDDCVVVEDTEVGIESGRAAGMQTVGVRGVTGDLPIRSLPDLHLWLMLTRKQNEEGEPQGFPFPFASF
jgi:sugar-phosphatase